MMNTRVVRSTCKECYVGCGSIIEVRDNKVVKISGNPANPHSRGAFCVKGMNAAVAAYQHEDRILYPMRRTGERGSHLYKRLSWEEALNQIGDSLSKVIETHGARAVAGAVSNQFYDRGVAMALLLRSMGSPNYMINQDLCQGCRSTAALLTGLTTQAGNELEKARCVLVVGKSPSDSNIIEWMGVRAARKAGAKLVVIDPRRTKIAEMADVWLPCRPGTDAALALSMIHVLFNDGLIDEQFVSEWCVGADGLRERTAEYAPSVVAEICEVPRDLIVRAAHLFGETKPGCLLLGHGIDAQANGVYTAIAFNSLLALTGNIDRPGANRLHKTPKGFREYTNIIRDPAFRLPEDREADIIGGRKYPLWSGPDSWGMACHNPDVIEAIHSGEPYPVRALYASGVNIVCTYPGVQKTISALRSLDVFIVATDHMTPTAELADFILPKTVTLEEEAAFIEDNCISIMQASLPRRGEPKTDFEIAIGIRDVLRERGLVEFEVLPWNTHREFIDFQLKDTGFAYEDLCQDGFREFSFEYEGYKTHGFNTPSGKVELLSSKLMAAGYDIIPVYRPPNYMRKDNEFDLLLLTGIRSMTLHHSRFRNHAWARRFHDVPELMMNMQTAQRHGVGRDDWVALATPHSSAQIYMRSKIVDDLPTGVVATGMGWWLPEIPSAERGVLTFNVEAVIPYDIDRDPISGSAEARNSACKIWRVDRSNVPELELVSANR